MKNKKGAKGQQQVKVLQQQQAMAGKTPAELAAQKRKEDEKKAKAEAEKLRKKELENILIIQPKVPFGVGESRGGLTKTDPRTGLDEQVKALITHRPTTLWQTLRL